MKPSTRFAGLALGLLACAATSTLAQTSSPLMPYVDYEKRLRATEMVSPLTSELLGDSVSLYNGTTTFSIVDIDLPGNNAVPVQLRRQFRVESHKDIQPLGGFGNWNIDVPYIYGMFDAAYKWNESGNNRTGRCSENWYPKTIPDVNLRDIWSGNFLHIPGAGDREILSFFETQPVPTDGQVYPKGTRDFYRFRCTATTGTGYPGEGFIAIDTNGTEYTFNVGIERHGGIMKVGALKSRTRTKVFLMASRVQDRHGNWVNYNYSAGKLNSITSSDGRTISLYYNGSNIARAVAHGREWNYTYIGAASGLGLNSFGLLQRVELPDNSAYTYTHTGELRPHYFPLDSDPGWCDAPEFDPDSFQLTATAPSGATGVFSFTYRRMHRSGTPKNACVARPDGSYYLGTPDYFDVYALTSKTISGPGLATRSWAYGYQDFGYGRTDEPLPCATCQGVKTVTVTQPDNSSREYHFGILYALNEGRLLGTDTYSAAGVLARTETSEYVTSGEAATLPFPDKYGQLTGASDTSSNLVRPVKRTVITQDGVTYSNAVATCGSVLCFDEFARPTKQNKSSPLGSKVDTVTFHDNRNLWALGQVATQSTDGVVSSRTDYDPSSALAIRGYSFGKLIYTAGYNPDGTLRTATDGRNYTTTLSNWKRGIPQLIAYPDSTDQSAIVDDSGWIQSVTDEAGFTTSYDYDPMGRLAQIAYPTGGPTWNATTLSFAPESTPVYGLPAGHWKQTVSTGNARKVTYFDALWQPIVQEQYDASDRAGTLAQAVKRYDTEGRPIFQSYPTRSLPFSSSHTTVTQGTDTTYDVLSRVRKIVQDSELGALTTTRNYINDSSGYSLLVTNPRQFQTRTWFRAFDQPTEQWPITIWHPEGANTDIERDVFGLPRSVKRRNQTGSIAVTRSYVYDSYRQLCKTIEPETGSTVMAHDAAGNLAWSAAGLSLPSTTTCDTGASVVAARKVTRGYDERNRLTSLQFPDGNGNQIWRYTPDGLPDEIETSNDGLAALNTYDYNNRRLPTGESISGPGLFTWSLGYGYNANGHLESHTYPTGSGLMVGYTPNALGQPKAAGTYATNVRYYPNGAMAGFTYGNGIVHSLGQNPRGLPDRSLDAYGATEVLDDGYDYDFNGNVAAISDGLPGARGNRTMTYDGLDRLKSTTSPMFSPASYSYDVLDNLKTVKVAGRDHAYLYDVDNRLTNVTHTATGATVIGLGYDVQGNLQNKNGQAFDFDYGNRLREVPGKETYRYDGHGRRVLATHLTQGRIFSMYGQDGVLRYQRNERTGKATSYISLNGSLVARSVAAFAPPAPTLTAPDYSTQGSYTVQWSAAASATRYELQESSNGGAWQAIYSGTARSKAISGKASGEFAYRVSACNATGCSGWSPTVVVVVELPPAAPPTLSVPTTAPNGDYTVSWGSASGATTYTLQERSGSGAWNEAYAGTARSQIYADKPAGMWGYRIIACNPGGCSPASAEKVVEVIYPPTAAPSVTSPSQSITADYTVSWAPVSGASSYQLEESANSGSWTNVYAGPDLSKSFADIAAGTYRYRGKACNDAGCGPVSATVTTVVIHKPASAPTLTAPSISNTGSYTVSWSSVATATKYRLYQSANGGSWTRLQDSASRSLAISGRGEGSYRYMVHACNAAGCGSDSAIKTVTVALPPQSAPTLTAPSSTSTGTFTLSWTVVADTDNYVLESRKRNYAWQQSSTTSTSMVASNKESGLWDFRVKACNEIGCGAYSAIRTVSSTAPAPPPPPTGLSASQMSSMLCRVTWSASSGASRYDLQSNGFTLYTGAQTRVDLDERCPSGLRVRACNATTCSGWAP